MIVLISTTSLLAFLAFSNLAVRQESKLLARDPDFTIKYNKFYVIGRFITSKLKVLGVYILTAKS